VTSQVEFGLMPAYAYNLSHEGPSVLSRDELIAIMHIAYVWYMQSLRRIQLPICQAGY